MCLVFLGDFIGNRKIGWLVVCLFVEKWRLVESNKKSLKSFTRSSIVYRPNYFSI